MSQACQSRKLARLTGMSVLSLNRRRRRTVPACPFVPTAEVTAFQHGVQPAGHGAPEFSAKPRPCAKSGMSRPCSRPAAAYGPSDVCLGKVREHTSRQQRYAHSRSNTSKHRVIRTELDRAPGISSRSAYQSSTRLRCGQPCSNAMMVFANAPPCSCLGRSPAFRRRTRSPLSSNTATFSNSASAHRQRHQGGIEFAGQDRLRKRRRIAGAKFELHLRIEAMIFAHRSRQAHGRQLSFHATSTLVISRLPSIR